jgi:histidine ammonia-lyase
VSLGCGKKTVVLDREALQKCNVSREYLFNQIKAGKIIYGVNSSYGSMCNKIIPDDTIELLQENLFRSHAAGLGEPLPPNIALAAVAVRLNSLLKGYSGVSVALLEFMGEVIKSLKTQRNWE